MAIWRKTVAIEPSMLSASSERRDSALPASASSRPNTIVSPNTDAVSASVSGVPWWKMPCRAASAKCTPWPSSCARIRTSRRRPVWLSITYGCTEGTAGAQNAPPRLLGRTGASIQPSSKKRRATFARSGENEP